MRGAGVPDEGEERECPLRGLNVCDGHTVVASPRGLRPCFCDAEQAAREVGWTGLATTYRHEYFDTLAAIVRHPASRNRALN